MKIAIDISPVVYGTGVSVYTANLVRLLVEQGSRHEFILFGGSLRQRRRLGEFLATVNGNFKPSVWPIPPTLADLVWNRLHILSIEKLVGKVDVFHSSDWTQPPSSAFKVTTVHDLAPLKFPGDTHPKIVQVHTRRLYWVKREVDRIIVPSQATHNQLVEYGYNPVKIRVIPEAPNVTAKADPEAVVRIKKKYQVRRYILGVGISPRKNTQRLIRAFESVSAGEDLKLILVGRPVGMQLKESRTVRLTGSIGSEELTALYTGAEALVYPSVDEGFGIPILDAFVCGTPVVTSNISSMPEVAGQAAVLVDPTSVEAIADGIKTALRRSEKLVVAGEERVKQFSWQKAAEATMQVYEEAR